ncbi:MAG: hypothetical protein ACRCZF_17665, partial [Gemmataceae bacterium]
MKRFLGLVGAATLAIAPAATAQDAFPGYLVVRVLLESNANPAVGAPANNPGAPPGGPGPGGGRGGPPGGGGGDDAPNLGGRGGAPGAGPQAPAPGGNRANAPIEAARSVVAVIPYSRIDVKPFDPNSGVSPNNPKWFSMKTRYGSSFVYADKTSIQFFPFPRSSVDKLIRDDYSKWSKNRSFDPIYDLTIYALQAGMVDEAFKYATEMRKLIDIQKGKVVPTKVTDFAKVFDGLQAKIDAIPTQPDRAEEWRQKLGAAGVLTGHHYSLIHWGEGSVTQADLDRRMAVLEQNFRAFYLWHSIQGVSLPVPDYRMIVVLANRSTDVSALREALDGTEI